MAQRVTTTSNPHRQVSEAQPLCSLLPGSPMHSTSSIFQQAMTCMFAFNAKSKESSAKMLHLNGTLLFVVSLYIRFYWGAFCDRTPPEKGGGPYWEPCAPHSVSACPVMLEPSSHIRLSSQPSHHSPWSLIPSPSKHYTGRGFRETPQAKTWSRRLGNP